MHRDEEDKAAAAAAAVPQLPLCHMPSPYLNYTNERRAVPKSTSSSSTTSRARSVIASEKGCQFKSTIDHLYFVCEYLYICK